MYFFLVFITDHHCGWYIVNGPKEGIHQAKEAEAGKAVPGEMLCVSEV